MCASAPDPAHGRGNGQPRGLAALALALALASAGTSLPAFAQSDRAAASAAAPALMSQVPATNAAATALTPAAATSPDAPPRVAPLPRPDDSNAQRALSQPGNNAPFWRGVRESGVQEGTVNLPGAEKGVLIQRTVAYPGAPVTNAGEAWRIVRNRWLIPYGGALVFIAALACLIFFVAKGRLGRSNNDGTKVIERFTPFERAVHWSNAIVWVVLAVSGLVMAFGKFTLLPIIGPALFGPLTHAMKTLHNVVGPLFTVSLVLLALIFVRDNIASLADFRWLAKLGGLFSDREVPSERFNPAEKGMYWWGVVFPGVVAIGSGLYLDQLLPGMDYLRGDMQVAQMIHSAATSWMMALIIGHIYIGTVGMRGAYRAMRDGWVDEAWAHEHHEIWYDDIRAGRIPAVRSADARRGRHGPPPAPIGDAPA